MVKIITLKGHQVHENYPNDLKIGPGAYFSSFYRIPKKYLRNLKNWPHLGQKPSIFLTFASYFPIILYEKLNHF